MNRNPMPAHIIRPQHSNATLRGMISAHSPTGRLVNRLKKTVSFQLFS